MDKELTWRFGDGILEQVTGATEADIKAKQKVLSNKFIGKELHRFYSPKKQEFVYRIGHTNRIISESEFETFVNNGLIVPKIRSVAEQLTNAGAHTVRRIVNGRDTSSIPIVEPSYYHVPSKAVPESTEETNLIDKASSAAMSFDDARHQNAIAGNAVRFNSIEDSLNQTGMIDVLNESDFFDKSPAPEFKPFDVVESKPTVVDAIKGFFARKTR